MPTPNQWAVREVALASFYSLVDGKAKLHLQNLKTSGLENSAEVVYARGGRGNAKIIGFSANREGRINLEDAVFTNEAIAMMTGNDLVEGAKDVYKRDIVTISTDSANLAKTPVGDLISLYVLNPDGSHGEEIIKSSGTLATGQYTISGKVITLFTGDHADGTQLVAYYYISTDATAKQIKVSSDKFAGSYKLVLDCLVRDTYTQKDYQAQIVVPTCKMEDNWSMSMSADGDPSTFTMPIEILKPSNGTDMWLMTIYDEELAL